MARAAGISLAATAYALVLQSCGLSGPFFDDSFEKSRLLSPEPVPAFRKLVAEKVRSMKDPLDTTKLAISDPRWIERVGGAAWIVCIRSDVHPEVPVYYAFFIQGEKVVDFRTAVGIDRCVHQEFVSFDVAAAH